MDPFETEIYLHYKQIIESQKACTLTCHPGLVPGSPFLCKTELSSLNTLVIPGSDRESPREAALLRSETFHEPRLVHMADLLDRYDAFCFDGYGTLYNRGSFVYPGAMGGRCSLWLTKIPKANHLQGVAKVLGTFSRKRQLLRL